MIELIRDWFDVLDDFSANNLERDIFAVETILSQSGNGVVLRGRGHQENMEHGLTQACLESIKM